MSGKAEPDPFPTISFLSLFYFKPCIQMPLKKSKFFVAETNLDPATHKLASCNWVDIDKDWWTFFWNSLLVLDWWSDLIRS